MTTPPALARALRTAPTCPDCGAAIGEKHDSCDVARCLWTGFQRLSCDYWLDYSEDPEMDPRTDNPDDPHDCGEDTWSGLWPGYAEAIEYDWWVRWAPPAPNERYGKWQRVTANDPDAKPDLNRLHVDCEWDRDARRWVKRS